MSSVIKYFVYNIPMEFSDWITKKYVDWRGNAVGRERSISEFATYVGVTQPVMSSWMKKGGKKPRSAESIQKLVNVFGDEVYTVLDLESPEEKAPGFWELTKLYISATPEEREIILEAARRASERRLARKRGE